MARAGARGRRRYQVPRRTRLGSSVAILVLAACPPAEEPPICPDGEVQDEETGACVAERCGSSPWGLVERDGDTIHVAPWGDEDGDGSEQRPLGSIQGGADEAGEAGGGTVAVAAGIYPENLELEGDHDGVRIVGRCAEMVAIDGSDGEDSPGVWVTGGEMGLSDLTVTGGLIGLLVQHQGFGGSTEVSIEDVAVVQNRSLGILVSGASASVHATSCSVAQTQPLSDGSYGTGVAVQTGAEFVATGLLVEANSEAGVMALQAGTTVDLEDVTVRDTRPLPDGTLGIGIDVWDGASLAGRRLLIEGNHDIGLAANGAGTTVELDDVSVSGTLPTADGQSGRGVSVAGGARLLARGLLLDGNQDIGLVARQGGTEVELQDSIVRGTRPLPDGTGGWGIGIVEGASLVASGLALEENCDGGLVALHTGTEVDLEDATVWDTQPLPEGRSGRGIGVGLGASLNARGLLLERNHEIGLLAMDAGTIVDVEDAIVRDTHPLPDGSFGRGIHVQAGASLVARALLLDGNAEVGLVAGHEGTTVDLGDSVVASTLPLPDGTRGRGIAVQEGANLVASGLLLDGNHDAGIIASHAGTRVHLEDAEVAGTRGASDTTSGVGLVVQDGAALSAAGLLLRDNDGPGIYVASGEVDASDALLEGNGFAGAVVFHAGLRLAGGTVSGSLPHPGEGGGTGIFAWDLGGPADLELEDLVFSDLVGPALYLRGPGRYVMRGCDVRDAGTWPWLPGGVLAVEGVEPWHEVGETGDFVGLLLGGNTFADLRGDAVLLDGSSATLEADTDTGAANAFSGLDGETLVWQRCGDLLAPEILDGSIATPSCLDPSRALGPLLEYRLWLEETEPAE